MSTAPDPSDTSTAPSRHLRRRDPEKRLVGQGRRWLRSADVGRGVRVTGPVLVRDRGTVVIGDDVVLDAADAPIELLAGPEGRLEIGSGVYVGPGASLEAGSSVSVGPGAVIGAYAKVLDNNWHGIGEDREARPESLPVVVGAGARLGVRSTMVPGSALGDGSVLDDDSVLSGRVPPGVRVAGVPARLVARLDSPAGAVGGAPAREGQEAAAFPQVGDGPGPVGTSTVVWLATLEGLGRLPLPAAARRGLAKAQLAAGMLKARQQLRGAAVGGAVFAPGKLDVVGAGRVQVGERTTFFGGPIRSRIETGPQGEVVVGPHCTFNYGVYLRAAERIDIGRGSLFGSRVLILDRHEGRSGPVRIGEEVWLAHAVTVLPGVTIGDGSAVSAGAVVDRDVPPGSLAFGSPLRFRPLSTATGGR